MFNNTKTTVKQGTIGLSAAIFYYQLKGYNVSLPLNDSSHYDLIIEQNDNLYTVQVKTTSQSRKNGYAVELKSVRPNRTKNVIKDLQKVDFIFVLCSNGDVYSLTYDKILNPKTNTPKKSLLLGIDKHGGSPAWTRMLS